MSFLKDRDIETVKDLKEFNLQTSRELGISVDRNALTDEAADEITGEMIRCMDRVQSIVEEDREKRRQGEES